MTLSTHSRPSCWRVADEFRVVGLEDDLREAVAVAQVDEDLIVVAAVGVDPAVEGDGLADVRVAQFAASVGPLPVGHGNSALSETMETVVIGMRGALSRLGLRSIDRLAITKDRAMAILACANEAGKLDHETRY